MNKCYLLLPIVFFVVGCATPKKELVYVTEYEYVTYELPRQLITSCKPERPLDISQYSNMNEDEKQTYLTNYVIMLLGDLKKCDSRIRGIERYIKDINALSKRS